MSIAIQIKADATQAIQEAGRLSTRLENMARKGAGQGGRLTGNQKQTYEHDQKQLEQVEKNWARIGKEVDKVYSSLSKLSKENDMLAKKLANPKIDPHQKSGLQGQFDKNKSDIDTYKKQIDEFDKLSGKYNLAMDKQAGSADQINGYKTSNKTQSPFAKLGAYAAGAVTLGTALAFLSHSRNKYVEYATGAEGLNARGFEKTFRRYLGYDPTQMNNMARNLHQQTGITDKNIIKELANYSTATNTEEGSGIGFVETMKNATGDDKASVKILAVLENIRKGTTESPERIGRLVGSNMEHVIQRNGGVISGTEEASVYGFSKMMMKMGALGMNPETFGIMQNALKPTGDQTTDIIKEQILGTYDAGDFTTERAANRLRRREEGLTNIENMGRFQTFMRGIAPEDRALYGKGFFGDSIKKAESYIPKIMEMDGNDAAEYAKQIEASQLKVDIPSSATYEHKGREAEKNEYMINSGQGLDEVMWKGQKLYYKAANKIMKTGVVEEAIKLAEDLLNGAEKGKKAFDEGAGIGNKPNPKFPTDLSGGHGIGLEADMYRLGKLFGDLADSIEFVLNMLPEGWKKTKSATIGH